MNASTGVSLGLVTYIAVIFSMGSLGIDGLLPALPQIAAELSANAPNLAPLTVSMFVVGIGSGFLIGGPLTDRFGRKSMTMVGCGIYLTGAAFVVVAPSLTTVLIARALQGSGAAIAHVSITGMVRDQYSGARMAKIMSFAMMIFSIMPAVAPLMGQFVLKFGPWRLIFIVYTLYGTIALLVTLFGRRETLPLEKRRPIAPSAIWNGVKESFSHDVFRRAIMLQTLCMGLVFASVANLQPIFEQAFDKAESFPRWFALIALMVFLSSFLNGLLVEKLGPSRVIKTLLLVQSFNLLVGTTAVVLGGMGDTALFVVFLLSILGVFMTPGLAAGNLNAMALVPLGHVAGTASSIIASISTLVGAVAGIPVTLMFDRTPVPLMLTATGTTLLALFISRKLTDPGSDLPLPVSAHAA